MENKKKLADLRKDKKGVFGLSAIQTFFVMLLGIALIAFVIVIIMGTLSNSTILSNPVGTTINETQTSQALNSTRNLTVNQAGLIGFSLSSVQNIYNSSGFLLPAANYTTFPTGVIQAVGTTNFNSTVVNASYTYTYYSTAEIQSNSILGNTSTGVSSFFSNINPVYAILAVLVIILVLVVLVRVVQAPNSGQGNMQL